MSLSVTTMKSTMKDVKEELSQRASDINDKMKQSTQKLNETMDNVQAQLTTYGNQIRDYLNKIHADIDGYRFVVEKQGDGLAIEAMFRAVLKPKEMTESE